MATVSTLRSRHNNPPKKTARALTYIVRYADGQEMTMRFTEAQANSVNRVLEPDGLELAAAINMVYWWNKERVRNGSPIRYRIPFVKSSDTGFDL